MPSLGCLPNISSAIRVLINSWLAEANVKKAHAELNVKHLCISRVLTAPPHCTPFSHTAEYIRESFSCLNGTWDPIRTTWEPDFEEYHPNSYRFLFKDAISAHFRLVLWCIAHIPRPTCFKSAFTVMSFEQREVKVRRQEKKRKKDWPGLLFGGDKVVASMPKQRVVRHTRRRKSTRSAPCSYVIDARMARTTVRWLLSSG